MNEADTSIFSRLQKMASEDSGEQLISLFNGSTVTIGSNPIVQKLTEQLTGNRVPKFG